MCKSTAPCIYMYSGKWLATMSAVTCKGPADIFFHVRIPAPPHPAHTVGKAIGRVGGGHMSDASWSLADSSYAHREA